MLKKETLEDLSSDLGDVPSITGMLNLKNASVGIEGIISQKFCWCFCASQTLYNDRTLESDLETQLDNFGPSYCYTIKV
jgi:hypothetical protein